MKVDHFYHLYADGQSSEEAFDEHFKSLKKSELLNIFNSIKISFIGSEEKISFFKNKLNNYEINYEILKEEKSGYEQVTINKLYEFSLQNDGYVFYAHTKGAMSNNRDWRRLMLYYNIIKWRDCLNLLEQGNDTVGCYLVKRTDLSEHVNHDYFYAGNFWWANLNYIRTLNYPLNDHRYNAEGWIGLNMNKKMFSFQQEMPNIKDELNDLFWL